MSKKDPTKNPGAITEFREGFNPEEASDVELAGLWYVPEAGSVVHFLPLERSEDVRHIFPPKDPTAKNDRPKHVWKCELMGPAVMMRDQELVQGKPGDLFLMFEQSRPALKNLLADACKFGFPVTLINEGKVHRFVRSQGTKRDVWSYKARIVTKPFKPLSNPSILALPSPEAAARLPEAITTAGESGD